MLELPASLQNIDLNALLHTYVIPWTVNILFAIAIFVVGRLIVRGITRVVRRLLVTAKMDSILIDFVASIVQSALLLFVIIAALDRLGVDTTSLVALLGAAGLAVGLALQGSLQNFASGVLLLVLRPFGVGNYIEAGGTAGVVERITIFHTVMKTPDNREVIVPNGAIFGGTITNFSARATRRIDLVFGIGYGDDIRKARDIILEQIHADHRILKDPEATVVVGELADSSVNLFARPWVNTADFWAVRCDLIENVKLAFDAQGISIPFPQMDVHWDGAGQAA